MAQDANSSQLQRTQDAHVESPLDAGQFVSNTLDAIMKVAGAAEAKGVRIPPSELVSFCWFSQLLEPLFQRWGIRSLLQAHSRAVL
jgi:hypothetical protein